MTAATRLTLASLVVLIVGGCAAGPTPAPSAADASISASPSSEGAVGPPACMDARFVFDPASERLLLASCVDQDDLRSTERIWAWDGASWEVVAADGPTGHVLSGVTWDAGRGALVRYGGIPLSAQECSHETWEWDGTAWRQADAEAPPACDHLRLAYDEARAQTILVGGGDEDQQLIPGTWAWNGTSWTRLTEDGPPPRAHFGLVYDAAHEQTFLYGGYDGAAVYDDFWSWDGAEWTQLGFEGPGPRSHFGMAVSPDGLLMFGGARSTSTFGSLVGETWYLTSGSWRRVEGPGPAPRGLPALGYDSSREVMVLYGGFDADGEALGDLWEWDGAWSCIAGCP